MTDSIRILHCLRAPVGGLFRHVLDLAGEQAARGHDVGIVADSASGDGLTEERFAAIEPRLTLGLHRIPMSRHPGLGDLGAAIATRRIARRLGVEILHGHGAKGGAYARLAAASLKPTGSTVRCFYTPHGGTLHFNPSSMEGRVYFRLEKLLARVTDGLIFESAFSRRKYDGHIGIGATPARVIPNGLAPADFVPHRPAPGAAEFLFVGELRHLKGVDVLLEALARMSAVRPVRAVIVGAGPEAEDFKALAESLGLTDKVMFTGAMPARAAFGLGRCLVVPSRAESFPYIVLEAAAARVPLIATNVGGIPEIVAGTDTGLVEPGNAEALTSAMNSFLADPAAALERAERLESSVARQFTIDEMTSRVLGFYAASRSAVKLTRELPQS